MFAVLMDGHLGGYYWIAREDIDDYTETCSSCGDSDSVEYIYETPDFTDDDTTDWGLLFYELYREYGLNVIRDFIEYVELHSYDKNAEWVITKGLEFAVQMFRDEAVMFEEEFVNGRKNKATE